MYICTILANLTYVCTGVCTAAAACGSSLVTPSLLGTLQMYRVGQNPIYIRCISGVFGRGTTKYTVTYSVCLRFWPTLRMQATHNRWATGKKVELGEWEEDC